MPGYADVYLLPVSKRHLADYRRIARSVGRIFREHGALDYRECVGDDLDAKGVATFPAHVPLRRGEILIYAAVSFRSKAHRDQVNKRVAADPRMAALAPKTPIFDVKRMVVGGFSTIVDV